MVLQSPAPVLVDFYADWCGPCRRLTPVLQQVARQTPTARVVKVNIDQSPDLARRYGVRSVPTMIVFRDGTAVAQRRGLASKAEIRRLLTTP
jgi:thioredoxin 1